MKFMKKISARKKTGRKSSHNGLATASLTSVRHSTKLFLSTTFDVSSPATIQP
jgi:hypothetical protein